MYEVSVYNESNKFYNPTLRSPNTPFEQPFYQTRDTLTDVDTYSQFLKNAIRRFRSSRTYKNYKAFIMSLCSLIDPLSISLSIYNAKSL